MAKNINYLHKATKSGLNISLSWLDILKLKLVFAQKCLTSIFRCQLYYSDNR
jgi:hypothetical protein